MRGCLVALAALVVVAVLVLWFALPLVVGGIATATLGAVGFHGTDTRVEVFADPPLRLLTLNADRVRVRSTDVTLENVAADTVDLTLRDVSINERRFGVIEGTLGGVTVTPDVGPPFEVSTVQLSGPSEAARATLTLDSAAAQTLVQSAVRSAFGGTVGDVTLEAPDRVTVETAIGPVPGRLVVNERGDLVLITSGRDRAFRSSDRERGSQSGCRPSRLRATGSSSRERSTFGSSARPPRPRTRAVGFAGTQDASLYPVIRNVNRTATAQDRSRRSGSRETGPAAARPRGAKATPPCAGSDRRRDARRARCGHDRPRRQWHSCRRRKARRAGGRDPPSRGPGPNPRRGLPEAASGPAPSIGPQALSGHRSRTDRARG